MIDWELKRCKLQKQLRTKVFKFYKVITFKQNLSTQAHTCKKRKKKAVQTADWSPTFLGNNLDMFKREKKKGLSLNSTYSLYINYQLQFKNLFRRKREQWKRSTKAKSPNPDKMSWAKGMIGGSFNFPLPPFYYA